MKFSRQKIHPLKLIVLISVVFVGFSCSLKKENTLPPEKNDKGKNTILKKNTEGKYEVPPDTLISIKKENFLGQYYTIIISADGNAILTPTQFGGYDEPKVPQNVPFKSRLTEENLVELLKKIEDINFFSMRDKYQMGDVECPKVVLDGTAKTFTVRIRGKQKSVYWENCENDRKMIPQQLQELEVEINSFVDLSVLY